MKITKNNFNYYLIAENNDVSIYEDDFNMFYYTVGNSELHEFIPYKVNNKKIERKGKSIIIEDINDFEAIIDKHCSPQFIELILLYIRNKSYENRINCWNKVYYIMDAKLC